MPAAGDVDIMIAAEMMEAGRAIMRGFVTPDRTTLIASTHRNLLRSAKRWCRATASPMPRPVREAASQAAKRPDRRRFRGGGRRGLGHLGHAVRGAGGRGALPFPREAFEAAIRGGGKGVEASLARLCRGYEAAERATRRPERPPRLRRNRPRRARRG
jgi:indolepyruvate ferredoxin oxidoreductase beta subunit